MLDGGGLIDRHNIDTRHVPNPEVEATIARLLDLTNRGRGITTTVSKKTIQTTVSAHSACIDAALIYLTEALHGFRGDDPYHFHNPTDYAPIETRALFQSLTALETNCWYVIHVIRNHKGCTQGCDARTRIHESADEKFNNHDVEAAISLLSDIGLVVETDHGLQLTWYASDAEKQDPIEIMIDQFGYRSPEN
jgi:hypothetical protein